MFLLLLFRIEKEEKDIIYLLYKLILTIFLIIFCFKTSLLLLFGIEKEEKDVIPLLYT